MEQFSLSEYLKNPSRKVVTRGDQNARIICTDRRDLNFPIIALIETRPGGEEVTYSYTKDGRYCNTCSDIYDLFFAPEKHEGFINIFRERSGYTYTDSYIYKSREDAKEACITNNYLTTVKIEWEE